MSAAAASTDFQCASVREKLASAWAEPVTFHNTLQDRPFTQTVYLARTAAEVPPAA